MVFFLCYYFVLPGDLCGDGYIAVYRTAALYVAVVATPYKMALLPRSHCTVIAIRNTTRTYIVDSVVPYILVCCTSVLPVYG